MPWFLSILKDAYLKQAYVTAEIWLNISKALRGSRYTTKIPVNLSRVT